MNEEIMSHIDSTDYDHKSIDASLSVPEAMTPHLDRGDFHGDTFDLQNLHHKKMYAPVKVIRGDV